MNACIRLILCLLCLSVLWPVDRFMVRSGAETVFQAPALPGQVYRTRYLHSVQLSEVVDEYILLSGRIWQWREYVLSHNAGLPFAPPPRSRFVREGDWMIIEGAHSSWDSLTYRVGNAEFGRNILEYPPLPVLPLYRTHPDERLTLDMEREIFLVN